MAVDELKQDGSGMTLKVFVSHRMTSSCNANTRFWDVSGIDITADASGVKVNTEGLMAILLAAWPSSTGRVRVVAEENRYSFPSCPDHAAAMKQPDREMMYTYHVF